MSARDLGGEAHAPAPHDRGRAPLVGADEYSAAPSRVVEAREYEATRAVAGRSSVIAAGTAVVGWRRGVAQRAVVVRTGTGATQ